MYVQLQNSKASVAQYDRNTGICMPYNTYGGETKSSKYFMMMFDKNIYSGMAYTGSRSSDLQATLVQNIDGRYQLKNYSIAKCSSSQGGDYIVDEYDQLESIAKQCSSGGFWQDTNGASSDTLYPKILTYTSIHFF